MIEKDITKNKKDQDSLYSKYSICVIFLTNLIFFLPYLFTSKPITIGTYIGDTIRRFKPIRQFTALQLQQGNFPFWNPFLWSGHPFIADPETAMFYPFTYLFAVLPLHLAFSWYFFFHYLICGIGLFSFCRRLNISHYGSLAAVFVYLFSAPNVLRIYAGHLTVITTLAWIPWVFWSINRFISAPSWKNAGVFGLLLAMQFLSGHAFYTYLLGLVLLPYLLYIFIENKLYLTLTPLITRLTCATLLSVGVFWVQAGLTLEFLGRSTRQIHRFSFTSLYAVSLENLMTLLVPKYFGETGDLLLKSTNYFGKTLLWENTCYMGIIALILFFIALRNWKSNNTKFWFFVVLFTFIIALGSATPLFKVCYEILPGFKMFRGYAKILSFTCLGYAILAGIGLDRILNPIQKRWNDFVFLLVLVLLFTLGAIIFIFPESLPFWEKQLSEAYSQNGIKLTPSLASGHYKVMQTSFLGVMFISLICAVVYFLSGRFFFLKKWCKIILCGLIFVEFFYYAKPYFSPLNIEAFDVSQTLYRPILEEPIRERVFHLDWSVANTMSSTSVSSVAGYGIFILKEYGKLSNYFNNSPLTDLNNYLVIRPTVENMKFYAARYLMGPTIFKPGVPLNMVASGEVFNKPYYLYKRRDVFTRFHIARSVKPLLMKTDEDNIAVYGSFVETMLREYPNTVFVGQEYYNKLSFNKTLKPEFPETKDDIRVVKEGTNHIVLDVHLSGAGILIVNENYYPGWHARIDGKETKVFPVNLIMQGIEVPSGRHKVKFNFFPNHFLIYSLISLVSLFVLLRLIIKKS